jgi:hypothetical protein
LADTFNITARPRSAPPRNNNRASRESLIIHIVMIAAPHILL